MYYSLDEKGRHATQDSARSEALAPLLTLVYDIHPDSAKYRYNWTLATVSRVRHVTQLIVDMYVWYAVDDTLYPPVTYAVTNRQATERALVTKITKTRSQ